MREHCLITVQNVDYYGSALSCNVREHIAMIICTVGGGCLLSLSCSTRYLVGGSRLTTS